MGVDQLENNNVQPELRAKIFWKDRKRKHLGLLWKGKYRYIAVSTRKTRYSPNVSSAIMSFFFSWPLAGSQLSSRHCRSAWDFCGWRWKVALNCRVPYGHYITLLHTWWLMTSHELIMDKRTRRLKTASFLFFNWTISLPLICLLL